MKTNFTPESDEERAHLEEFIETVCLADVAATLRAISYDTNDGLTKILVESEGTGALKYLYAYKNYPTLCFRDEYGVIKGYNGRYEGLPPKVVQESVSNVAEPSVEGVSAEVVEPTATVEESSDKLSNVSEVVAEDNQLVEPVEEVVVEKTTTKRGRKKKSS